MSTPEQDTLQHKFSKSGRIPPPLPSKYRKPRSHSLSSDLDQQHESSSDETAHETPLDKLDFAGIRKKFENPKTPEVSQPQIYKKRPSIPITPIIQTNISPSPSPSSMSSIFTTHFKQSNETTTTQTTPVRQSVFSKGKSSSPTPFSDASTTIIKKIFRSSMNSMGKNGINSSAEEQDRPLSPSLKSPDSLLQSGNGNNEHPKSVRK
ncbi:unnamed protein product, partial [Rotaria sp. Silwood2]